MSAKTKALSEKLAYVPRSKPVCVQDKSTVSQTIKAMRDKKAPCAVVCRGRKMVGIFTERDYMMKAIGRAKPSDPIRRFMTSSPIVGRMDESMGEAVEVMSEKALRNLPLVNDKGEPASLVTVTGLIRYLASHFPAEVMNQPPSPHLVAEDTGGA